MFSFTTMSPLSVLLILVSSCDIFWTFISAAPDEYGFITAGDSLYNISMDTQVIQKLPISGLAFPAGVDYDPVEDKIYWAEFWGNKLGRCNSDGSMQELNFITETNRKFWSSPLDTVILNSLISHTEPYGLVLDVINRWVYWTAEDFVVDSVLNRAKLDGSQRMAIARIGPASPKHIALDPTQNKLYWTDQYNRGIRRINADGTGSIEIIVDASMETSIIGIALDVQAGLLFWCDWTKDTIEVYDFEINQIRTIYQSAADINPYGIALYGHNIYWVDNGKSYLQTVPKAGVGSGVLAQTFGTGSNVFNVAYGLRIKSTNLCSPLEPICLNGGTCLNQPSGIGTDVFTCLCTANYRGRVCETFQEIPKCPTPVAPENGFISSTLFEVGTTITFICLPGFVIVGASQAMCREDLTWSVDSPSCVHTCPTLQAPANGAITPITESYFVGDQITFSCMNGFNLIGLTLISCTPSGAWSSGSIPTCHEIVTCPQYDQPPNGFISGPVKYTAGSTISFICSPGYVIVGASQTTCREDLTWSVQWPYCARSCLMLTPPQNGFINPPDGPYLAGQQVTYNCNTGYRLVGLGTIMCTNDGQWPSVSTPSCALIITSCPPPILPDNGQILPLQNAYDIDQSITFQCNNGYQLFGSSTAVCLSNGMWSVAAPTCQSVSCIAPSAPIQGYLQPDQTSYSIGQQVTFLCNEGYQISSGQSSSAVCSQGGSWSSETPTCTELTCDPPLRPDNVFITPDLVYYGIGHQLTFYCHEGYEIYGHNTAICMSHGSWTNSSPICHEIMCRTPDRPINGDISPALALYSVDQMIEYKCDIGFVLSGQRSSVCLQNGLWSSPTPTCQALTCLPPSLPGNGTFAPVHYEYQIGQQVHFLCNNGFQLAGETIISCLANGNWSNSSTICKEVTCLIPSHPGNGFLFPSLTTYAYGQQVTFQCNQGFHLVGEETVACVYINTWSNAPPACEEIACSAPSQPQDGGISPLLSSYEYNQWVNFQCNPGFYLTGETTVTCIGQNTWSNLASTCEALSCMPPAQPDNGFISPSLSSYAYEQQVFFSCATGYQLVGGMSVTCVAFNTWSNAVPMCVVITCAAPAQPQNGFISAVLSSYAFDQRVTFACNTGYQLVGEPTVTCITQNTWSSPAPVCQEIRCGSPAQPQNGNISPVLSSHTYQQQVTFTCDVGYHLVGDATITCVSENTWSDTFPTCSAVTCSRPQEPQNGYLSPGIATYAFQQEVTFRCNDGFDLVGDPASVCLQRDTWSNPTPSCEAITCPPLGRPNNGQLFPDLSSYGVNDQVQFQCNTGYHLIGQTYILFCLFSGMWSSEAPTCEEITCSTPVHPTNGLVAPYMNTNRVGTQLTFTCSNGYQISGSSTVRCTAEGTWSSPFPRCVQNVPTSCQNPPFLTNGNIVPTLTSYAIGSSLTYSCFPGFDLHGAARINCTSDGSWSAIFPTCVEHVTCPSPDIPADGDITPSSGPYDEGTQVVFNCNFGFQLRGVPAVVCQQDGSWSAESPICIQGNCLPPDVPENGKVVPYGNIPSGLNVTFECDRGFRLDGSRQATCLQTLIWNRNSPTCVAVTCASPMQLDNGNIQPVEAFYNVNAQITYSCNSGYRLLGMSTVTCSLVANNLAIWSPQPPICVEEGVMCNQLAHPLDGIISPSRDGPYPVGERVTFTCNSDFELKGQSELYCTNDGTWSGDPPLCEDIELTCPPLVVPSNGFFSPPMGPYPVGQTVHFTCHNGYMVTGTTTVVCTLDGDWSDNAPSCAPLECRAPGPLLNGFITPDVSPYTIGFKIDFSCKLGYTLEGSDSSVCTNQQIWSEEIPACLQQDPTCITPSTLSQKLIILPDRQSYEIGEVVKFACENGYVLDMGGKDTAVCTKDRIWSDSFPACIEMAGDTSFLSQIQDNVQLVMWIGIPSAFVILLVVTVCCIVVFRRHRRGRSPTNEDLVMAYRKENRTLPAGQGTDIYNVYGGRDNRPVAMMRQQQPEYRSHSPHLNNLNQHDELHYQSSLQRTHDLYLDTHSLPRSTTDSHRSMPQSSLPAAESSAPSYVNLAVTPESGTLDRQRASSPGMNQLTRV